MDQNSNQNLLPQSVKVRAHPLPYLAFPLLNLRWPDTLIIPLSSLQAHAKQLTSEAEVHGNHNTPNTY